MSAKRMLDLVGLVRATRGVAAQHIALRRRQVKLHSKTSSLWKAIDGQLEAVAQIYQKSSSIVQNTSSSTPTYTTQARDYELLIPSKESVGEEANTSKNQRLPDQEVFYQKPQANSTANPVLKQAVDVQQEEASRDPLPDSTVPPLGYNAIIPNPPSNEELIRAEEARWAQRQAEVQIPSIEAESRQSTAARDNKKALDPGLGVQQDRDVFSTPSSETTAVLSSFPQIKISKNLGTVQEGHEHVQDKGINQDVLYSPPPKPSSDPIPHTQAISEQDVSEEMYSGLFHSPRVARMLKGNPSRLSAKDKLSLQDSRKVVPEHRGELTPNDSLSSSTTDENGRSHPKLVDKDVKQLTQDIQGSAEPPLPGSEGFPQVQSNPGTAFANPYKMNESRVPSSRFGRLWQYGGLATSMAFGAVGESFRRATGSARSDAGSLMLSGANVERLVAKLSRMRGAALKLGQMISFQDSKMLPTQIHQVLQRVQDSADYMPSSQRNKVLVSNLGSNWRDLFSSFDDVPLAAASIGQVHSAILKETGMRVAVKIQYPGVANSIESDLNNLSLLLTASKLLPKGLYLDKTIANARVELAWECDYLREANAAKRFRGLLVDEQDIFQVPEIVSSASATQVLTMERMEGIGITKIQNFSQEQKDWIGTQILRLCLRELTEFHYMQTDPNWTNFLYNRTTDRLELLDFGASRDYPAKFIEPYIKLLYAASRDDRVACYDLSIQLGYLTGHESKAMREAHVNSIMTLAEPFAGSSPDIYDFRDQTVTDRVRAFIPVMLRERLAPPPEETYSLHRKLSGAFLLCARLGSRIRCKEMFENAMRNAAAVL